MLLQLLSLLERSRSCATLSVVSSFLLVTSFPPCHALCVLLTARAASTRQLSHSGTVSWNGISLKFVVYLGSQTVSSCTLRLSPRPATCPSSETLVLSYISVFVALCTSFRWPDPSLAQLVATSGLFASLYMISSAIVASPPLVCPAPLAWGSLPFAPPK